MTQKLWAASAVILGVVSGWAAMAGTVTGTVSDARGKPVANAYVSLRDDAQKMTITALTDGKGRYRVSAPGAAAYKFSVRRFGYGDHVAPQPFGAAAARQDVTLAPVADSTDQQAGNAWLAALPNGATKTQFITGCTICHDMGSPITRQPRDEAGWADIITMMRSQNDIYSVILHFDTAEMAKWLTNHKYGERSLPLDPFAPGKVYNRARISEYDVGAAESWTHDMAVEPSTGAAWVGDYVRDELIRVDPDSGKQTIIPLPVKHTGLHTVHFAPDGRLWMTLQLRSEVAVYDPKTGKFRIYEGFGKDALTHSFSYDDKGLIKADGDGNVWISQFGNNTLARLNPVTGVVKTFKLQGKAGHPYGVVLDRAGRVWFTKYSENLLGYLDPKTGEVKEFPLPVADSGPHRMHIDNKNRLWIPASGTGTLLRYDIDSGKFKEYALPDPDSFPYAARYDGPSDSVWINGNGANALYRLDLKTEKFEVYRIPSSVAYSRMVSVDHKSGAIWTVLSSYPNKHALRDHGVLVRFEPGK